MVSQNSGEFSQGYSERRDLFPYLGEMKKNPQKLSSIQTLDQRAHPNFAAHYITPYIRSRPGLKKREGEREEAQITVLLLILLAHHKKTHLRFPTFHHPFSLNSRNSSVTADALTRRSPRFAA